MRLRIAAHSSRFIQFLIGLNIYLKSAVITLLFLSVYHVFTNLNSGIHPIHEWRKSDSMSIALNYYKGAPFLEPQTQWISEVGNRHAAAEFPIYYYIIGKIWLITGPSDLVYKLGSLLLFFTGLVLFSQVAATLFKSDRLALLLLIFIISSPVLIFYAEAGIPNPISFSFLLISTWFLNKYLHANKRFYLAGFFIFSSLSILVKVTAIIAYASFGGAALLFLLLFKRSWFKSHGKLLFSLVLSIVGTLLMVYLWYSYAIRYNQAHDSGLFSTTIRPAWEVSAAERAYVTERLVETQLPRLLYLPTFLLLSLLALAVTYIKGGSNYLKLLIPVQLAGVAAYLILWFWVFTEHDYYLIEVYFLPISLAFCLLYFISKAQERSKPRTEMFFSIIILINILYTSTYTYHSFGLNKKENKDTLFIDKKTKDAWAWYHYNHEYHLGKLYTHKNRIQALIPKEDTVFCISDHTPNTHLYVLDRIGYSYFSYNVNPQAETIDRILKKGVKYVVRVGQEAMDKQYDPLFANPVDSIDGIYVYRVTNSDFQ